MRTTRGQLLALGSLLLGALLLAGCGAIGQGAGRSVEQILLKALNENVDFELQSFEPNIRSERGTGFFGLPTFYLTFDIELGIENQSAIPLLAKSMDFHLYTSPDEFDEIMEPADALANAIFSETLRIPRGESVTIPLTIEAPVEDVGRELVNRIRGDELFYRLDALIDFNYKGVTLPYEVTLEEGSG